MQASSLSLRARRAPLFLRRVNRRASRLVARAIHAAAALRNRRVLRRQAALRSLLEDFNEREWLSQPARRAEEEARRLHVLHLSG